MIVYNIMLPQNVKYQPKVESASARRFRTNIQPQTGTTFSNSNTIIINIPTRANTLLIPSESVLKATVSFTTSAAAPICALESAGHHSWINRCRVFHGSNLLSDIQEYHQLAKILMDFQMPLDSVQGRYSVTSGTTNEYTATAADASGCIAVKPVNRGRNYSSGTPAGFNGTQTDSFAINLISLVGALSGNKYLPLFEMTSAPLRVELVLQDNINKAMNFSAGAPANGAFTLSNVEYVGEFLELPDSAIAAIKAGSSSPLQMVVPDYRAYTFSQSIPNNTTTQVSMPIPAKFSSLKSIFLNQRRDLGNTGYYPSSSGTFNLSQYQFRIGSSVVPSNPPTTLSEYFTEACKCFGSVADIAYQPAVDRDAYIVDVPTALTTYAEGMASNSGSFVVGIDCESYMAADKSSVFAGMNTNTDDIYWIGNILQATGNPIPVYWTAFANFDSVLVCENGVAYCRF